MRGAVKKLLAFGGLAHDPQGVLAAVHRLALVGIELRLKIGTFELGVAALAHADSRRGLFHDSEFALEHVQSLTHREGRA
jgi:hypothetical protein